MFLKPEEIIYYNELTKKAEPFTQKNIDDNKYIDLGGNRMLEPEGLLDELFRYYSTFAQTVDYDISYKYELENRRKFIAINYGIQNAEFWEFDRQSADPLATLVFKLEDVNINGVKGKALAMISDVWGYDPSYVQALLSIARCLFYDGLWEKYMVNDYLKSIKENPPLTPVDNNSVREIAIEDSFSEDYKRIRKAIDEWREKRLAKNLSLDLDTLPPDIIEEFNKSPF